MEPIEPSFTVEPPSQPRRQPPKRNSGWIMGVLVAIGAVALKFIAPLLVFAKTAGTMIFSIGAYSLFLGWSWQFATGFVVMIFVHEMGHFFAAKYYGVPVSAPIFIPFVGAYVMLSKLHMSSWMNALISYAGPLAGGIGGWFCFYLAGPLDWPWLVNVAFYTFLLNLINLAPVPPLDGSHIWTAFVPGLTPDMRASDRGYTIFFLMLLIAGLLLGILISSPTVAHFILGSVPDN